MVSETNPLLFPMLNQFHLTEPDSSQMDNYFILHWSGAWFSKQYSTSDLIKKDGIYYIILFDDLEHAALNKSTLEVALSFRFCKAVNNVHGYVIVRKVK